MKVSLFRVVVALIFVFIFNPISQAWADDETPPTTRAAMSCAVATGVSLLGAIAAGPGELIMIAGGGSLAPSATAPLMISLTATAFVAACGIGISAEPAVSWFSEQVGVFLDGLWGGNIPATNAHDLSKPILAANAVPVSGNTLAVQSSR